MIGFGFFDSVFPVLFTVMFVLILGVIIVTLVRNVSQWHKKQQVPAPDRAGHGRLQADGGDASP